MAHEEKVNVEIPKPRPRRLVMHAKGFIKGIWDYVYHFFHIKEDIDIPGTLVEIKKGLDFGGARAWILMSAIFIPAVKKALTTSSI